jgi:hypothetical protein
MTKIIITPEFNANGVIIPEDRIVIYQILKKFLAHDEAMHNGNAFMCNQFSLAYGRRINLNTRSITKSPLPELRKQRPHVKLTDDAWYHGEEYALRQTALDNAIALWKVKYAK